MPHRSLQFLLIVAFSLVVRVANAQTFSEFRSSVDNASDSVAKANIINEYLSHHSVPVVEDSLAHFLYRGNARMAGVAGEFDGWDPRNAWMSRLEQTDLFVTTAVLPVDGRMEYKLWVDSAWILDPLNPRTGMGGFGANSDVWMPKYVSHDIDAHLPTNASSIDTFWFESTILRRKHPVFVYQFKNAPAKALLPLLYVTDGGDYLTFGKLNFILDSLIGAGRLSPIVAVCVDPRTDLNDQSSNHRMDDYAASEEYLDFLEKELSPYIEQRYPVSHAAADRVMIGASMGGLISTYAALTRPEFFPNCVAQSPAYAQAGRAVFKVAEKITGTPSKFYIETGTINDAQDEARIIRDVLKQKGANLVYEECPEGHNWTNWRTHLPKILQVFFPPH